VNTERSDHPMNARPIGARTRDVDVAYRVETRRAQLHRRARVAALLIASHGAGGALAAYLARAEQCTGRLLVPLLLVGSPFGVSMTRLLG
jgi:hypothetical protein